MAPTQHPLVLVRLQVLEVMEEVVVSRQLAQEEMDQVDPVALLAVLLEVPLEALPTAFLAVLPTTLTCRGLASMG